jgi:hypothetical protein
VSVKKYRVKVGISYPTVNGERHAEPGEAVDDLPAGAAEWMLADGAVEEIRSRKVDD